MRGLTKLQQGPGNVALSDRPELDPGRGEVLLEVRAAGICGTDLHIEAGEFDSIVPVTMGHEVCGTVISLGEGVDPSWLGARVVSETFYSTCGACSLCRAGRVNLCPHRRSIGSHVDGAFAPRLVVPVVNLHRPPDWLSDQAASLTEPLACVCQCLLDPELVAPGDSVLVTGPGPIGLLSAAVARALGGQVVVAGLATDVNRLAAARAQGFDVAISGEALGEFDVAIECSGSTGGLAVCLESARPAGTFAQMGIFGRPVEADLDLVLLKELRFNATFASTPRAWRRALALIESHAIELDPLVSAVVGLDEWADAFADLRAGRSVKIVLDPRRG